MAGDTRWFVVASPTGSTINEFFTSGSISSTFFASGSTYINLLAISESIGAANWGTVGHFPTNSVYSPGIYIRDYQGSSYVPDVYTYTDANTSLPVTSIQQDLQKIFFPGIATGSLSTGYGGKLVVSGALPGIVGNTNTGSIGFTTAVPVSPASWGNVISMSIAPNSFNRVNFSTFFNNLSPNTSGSDYQIIYRDLESQQEAVYNVLYYDSYSSNLSGIASFRVQNISNTGGPNPILNNSSSITFINKNQNQQTFYIVGVANPAAGLPFAGQSTVGSVGASGDFRSGIIKVYATESNNTADWTSLIRTVSGDVLSDYTNWEYVAANHNLIMFTASAGNASTSSWQLLVSPPSA